MQNKRDTINTKMLNFKRVKFTPHDVPRFARFADLPRFIRNTIFATIAFWVLLTSVAIYACFGEEPEEDYLIVKSYGSLIPKGEGYCKKHHVNSILEYYKNGLCRIGYFETDKDGRILSNVTLEIFRYDNDDYVKNDLLFEWYERVYRNSVMKYELANDGYAIKSDYPNPKHKNSLLLWIHNSNIIKIQSNRCIIPTEMKNDYMKKYPPTRKFEATDFDVQKVLHKELEKKFYIIDKKQKELEAVNVSKDKSSLYLFTLSQCKREMNIRCWADMKNDEGKVECPIAMNMDVKGRRSQYEAFEKEISSKKLAPENVNWEQPVRIKCTPWVKDYDEFIKSKTMPDKQ